MDKKEEIRTLRSLKGDTYFNQYFTNEDIEQMCENISNDFAIEMGCNFHIASATLEKKLREATLQAAEEEQDMVANFVKMSQGEFPEGFYEYCVERVGRLFIIKCKKEYNIALTGEEIDFLIRVADRNINPEFKSNK